MFEFLGEHEFIHLITHFMHAWHKTDENEELRQKRLRREYDERRKRTKQDIEAAAEEIDEVRFQKPRLRVEEENRSVVEILSPTIAQISEGTKLSHDQIRQIMKKAEDQFVHWPHPEHPDMTRYALREHAEELGLKNWQPGTGF